MQHRLITVNDNLSFACFWRGFVEKNSWSYS